MSNEYKDWLRDKEEDERIIKIEAYKEFADKLIADWEEHDYYCGDLEMAEWIEQVLEEKIGNGK